MHLHGCRFQTTQSVFHVQYFKLALMQHYLLSEKFIALCREISYEQTIDLAV